VDSLFVAVSCLLLGVLLRRLGRLPEGADRTVSGVVIQLSAPPVSFLAARTMPLSAEMLLPASMAWIVFAGGFAFFGIFRRVFGFSQETFGCLMLTAALSNVVFIGLPMIEAFFGHQLVYVAFLCDSPGVSLVLALPGVLLASSLSPLKRNGGAATTQMWQALRRVLLFPPFEGLVLGLALRSVPLPEWLLKGLAHIGMTIVPLSLFAVGLGLSFRLPKNAGRPLALGLGYKLILAPLIMLAVVLLGSGNTNPVAQVTVFEAAMPPMVLGGILATDYGLDAKLAALLVSVGTPLSFVTLPLWRWLLASI
jgi:malate permease and related proteins